MESLGSFLEMGGYARYVWPAFALTALVMIGLAIESLRSLRARTRLLATLQAPRRPERRRDRP